MKTMFTSSGNRFLINFTLNPISLDRWPSVHEGVVRVGDSPLVLQFRHLESWFRDCLSRWTFEWRTLSANFISIIKKSTASIVPPTQSLRYKGGCYRTTMFLWTVEDRSRVREKNVCMTKERGIYMAASSRFGLSRSICNDKAMIWHPLVRTFFGGSWNYSINCCV